MIRLCYYAASAPVAMGATSILVAAGINPVICFSFGSLVVVSSTWPGLVGPRYKGRMHPFAALARGTAYLGYLIRTRKDTDRGDLDRGPSYCLEWCLGVGSAVTAVTSLIPPLAPWAWWWGAGVALGCAVHVLVDLLTPSGVPLCAVYNAVRYGEVWRRHSLGWSATDSGTDRYMAVPVLFALTGVMFLGLMGALGPIVSWLTGA